MSKITLPGHVILSGSGVYGEHTYRIDDDEDNLRDDFEATLAADGRVGGMLIVQYDSEVGYEAGTIWFDYEGYPDYAANIILSRIKEVSAGFAHGRTFVA